MCIFWACLPFFYIDDLFLSTKQLYILKGLFLSIGGIAFDCTVAQCTLLRSLHAQMHILIQSHDHTQTNIARDTIASQQQFMGNFESRQR